jgi:hypothetical protein
MDEPEPPYSVMLIQPSQTSETPAGGEEMKEELRADDQEFCQAAPACIELGYIHSKQGIKYELNIIHCYQITRGRATLPETF